MKANKWVLKFWQATKAKDEKRIAMQAVPDFDEAILDLDYVGDGDPMHTLNVYRPRGAQGKLPVIMDIHGGGWYYGDKELNSYFCRSLVVHGFAVVDISYRLAPEADIFGQIKDVFAAMRFIKEHSEKFGLDVDAFFIVGDSAGGHLAGLASNININGTLQEAYGVKCSLNIKGAGLICPAADPPEIFPLPKGLMKVYFNPIFGKGYLKNGVGELVGFSSTLQKNICPCYFVTAYGDFLRKSVLRAHEAVKAIGARTQLCYFEKPQVEGHKLDHVFNVTHWDWEESQQANKGMCDFFKSVLE